MRMIKIFYRPLILLLLLPCLAYPASQTKIVGTCVNDPVATNVDWTEPGDATADDGNNTGGVGGDRIQDTEESDRLKGTMSGNIFTIPGTATIDSIKVEIDIIDNRNKDEGQDLEVRLIKAGSPVGNDESKAAAVPGVQTIRVYAPLNLWGTTWTPAQINATDFGVGLRLEVIGDAGRCEAGVDFLRITVHYTPAAGGAVGQIIMINDGG